MKECTLDLSLMYTMIFLLLLCWMVSRTEILLSDPLFICCPQLDISVGCMDADRMRTKRVRHQSQQFLSLPWPWAALLTYIQPSYKRIEGQSVNKSVSTSIFIVIKMIQTLVSSKVNTIPKKLKSLQQCPKSSCS